MPTRAFVPARLRRRCWGEAMVSLAGGSIAVGSGQHCKGRIGPEDVEDLLDDLQQALDNIFRLRPAPLLDIPAVAGDVLIGLHADQPLLLQIPFVGTALRG